MYSLDVCVCRATVQKVHRLSQSQTCASWYKTHFNMTISHLCWPFCSILWRVVGFVVVDSCVAVSFHVCVCVCVCVLCVWLSARVRWPSYAVNELCTSLAHTHTHMHIHTAHHTHTYTFSLSLHIFHQITSWCCISHTANPLVAMMSPRQSARQRCCIMR